MFDAGGKIFFAPYVTVGRCQTFFAVGISPRQIIRVCPGLEYVHHVADAAAACFHGRGTPGHKTFLPVLLLQVHDATAGPESKLGITLVLDDSAKIVHHDVVDYCGTGKNFLQVALAAPLASGQIVGRLRGVFIRGVVAVVCRARWKVRFFSMPQMSAISFR